MFYVCIEDPSQLNILKAKNIGKLEIFYHSFCIYSLLLFIKEDIFLIYCMILTMKIFPIIKSGLMYNFSLTNFQRQSGSFLMMANKYLLLIACFSTSFFLKINIDMNFHVFSVFQGSELLL